MKFQLSVFALLLSLTGVAHAEKIYNPRNSTPVQTIPQANAVVLGKVTSIEKELVEVASGAIEIKGADVPKTVYKIANVKISESLMGAKGITTIKVGFNVDGGHGDIEFEGLGGGKFSGRLNIYGISLSEGQEGLFIISRHPSGEFYTFTLVNYHRPMFYDKKVADYERRLAETKIIINAMKDPISALKAKEKEDRISALAFLVLHYGESSRAKPVIQENLSAEESKLILKVALEMDWVNSPADINPDSSRALESVMGFWLHRELSNHKYVYPSTSGLTGEEAGKIHKAALKKFIEENGDKLILKKFVEKK